MLMPLKNAPCHLHMPIPGRKKQPYHVNHLATLEGRQGYSVCMQAVQEWTVRQDSPSIVSFQLIGFSKNGSQLPPWPCMHVWQNVLLMVPSITIIWRMAHHNELPVLEHLKKFLSHIAY